MYVCMYILSRAVVVPLNDIFGDNFNVHYVLYNQMLCAMFIPVDFEIKIFSFAGKFYAITVFSF